MPADRGEVQAELLGKIGRAHLPEPADVGEHRDGHAVDRLLERATRSLDDGDEGGGQGPVGGGGTAGGSCLHHASKHQRPSAGQIGGARPRADGGTTRSADPWGRKRCQTRAMPDVVDPPDRNASPGARSPGLGEAGAEPVLAPTLADVEAARSSPKASPAEPRSRAPVR